MFIASLSNKSQHRTQTQQFSSFLSSVLTSTKVEGKHRESLESWTLLLKTSTLLAFAENTDEKPKAPCTSDRETVHANQLRQVSGLGLDWRNRIQGERKGKHSASARSAFSAVSTTAHAFFALPLSNGYPIPVSQSLTLLYLPCVLLLRCY